MSNELDELFNAIDNGLLGDAGEPTTESSLPNEEEDIEYQFIERNGRESLVYDKEDFFDSHIKEKVKKIVAGCNSYNLPVQACFEVKRTMQGLSRVHFWGGENVPEIHSPYMLYQVPHAISHFVILAAGNPTLGWQPDHLHDPETLPRFDLESAFEGMVDEISALVTQCNLSGIPFQMGFITQYNEHGCKPRAILGDNEGSCELRSAALLYKLPACVHSEVYGVYAAIYENGDKDVV